MLLLLTLPLLVFSTTSSVDHVFINSVQIGVPKLQLGACKIATLTINEKQYASAVEECRSDGASLTWASTEFPAVEGQTVQFQFVNTAGDDLRGNWGIDQKMAVNTPHSSQFEMKGNFTITIYPTKAPTSTKPTTLPPTKLPIFLAKTNRSTTTRTTKLHPSTTTKIPLPTAVLTNQTAEVTITWIRVKYGDNNKTDPDSKAAFSIGGNNGFAILSIYILFLYI